MAILLSPNYFLIAMTSAEISPVFVCLLCSVFEAVATAATAQRSSLFNTLQLSGSTQCCANSPSATLGVRSARECSLRCIAKQDEGCQAHNFKEDELTCELFDNTTSNSNCTVTSGCSFYVQVEQINADPQFVSAENCSFPFTYAGQLYYSCAYDPVVSSCFKFCFLQNRILAFCTPWTADYQVFNETINMTIPVTSSSPPVLVQTVNGWIMIQQKLDASCSFNRTWTEFQSGFGELSGTYYWLGLDRINALTEGGDFKLRVELQENITGLWFSAEYLYFQVDDATSLYRIHLAEYTGDAYDGFLSSDKSRNISGRFFTTLDENHDAISWYNCAGVNAGRLGGWWYNDCAFGEPNGAEQHFRWFYNLTEGMLLQTSRMMAKLADE